jgi:hypothetical protein
MERGRALDAYKRQERTSTTTPDPSTQIPVTINAKTKENGHVKSIKVVKITKKPEAKGPNKL